MGIDVNIEDEELYSFQRTAACRDCSTPAWVLGLGTIVCAISAATYNLPSPAWIHTLHP